MIYRNILIQVLCNTGDVVLCTSAIALLKKAYPEAKMTAMVRPGSREIVENNPVVDDVIVAEYKSKQWSVGAMLNFVKQIKKNRFDLCICFDGKLRSALYCYLAGIPVRVAANDIFTKLPYWRRKLFTHIIPPDCDIARSHQTEIFQSVIRQFTGIKGNSLPVIARITDGHKTKVQHLISELPSHTYRIALCVKGTFALKDWPQQNFTALIEQISQLIPHSAFYIIGAPGDREYADGIITGTRVPVANLCGLTGLIDLAELLNQSHMFITVDTGAVHIASTTNTKVIAIYGCTAPVRWHPLNECYAVIHAGVHCSPCSVPADACPEEHACMKANTVDKVLQTVTKLHRSNEITQTM